MAYPSRSVTPTDETNYKGVYMNSCAREFREFLRSMDTRTEDEFLLDKILTDRNSFDWLMFARKLKYDRINADKQQQATRGA